MMPHLIVHYAKPLKESVQAPTFKETLIKVLIQQNLFDEKTIKYRSISIDDYALLDPSMATFLHIEVRILAGRHLSARVKLSKELAEVAKGLLKPGVETSCEVCEIEKETYSKCHSENK